MHETLNYITCFMTSQWCSGEKQFTVHALAEFKETIRCNSHKKHGFFIDLGWAFGTLDYEALN